jgi:hypothetical protein
VLTFKTIFSLAMAATLAAGAIAASAQQSFYERLRAHNTQMTAVQPAWMGPLIQTDSRLSQAVRVSVSNSYAPGEHTLSYGNFHGIGLIVGDRIQLNLQPPPYMQNHSATFRNGFSDAVEEAKVRIASGNAEHGNYTLTAFFAYSIPTGSHQNGAPSGAYIPILAAGKGFGRFDVQSTLGGALPTAQIAAQGRSIGWNTTAQVHPSAHLWFDVENNATFNYGGPFDGKTQNFLTPAAFYLVRRKDWPPAHAMVVFDAGMQIATSGFHLYNHNLITEARILF